MTLVEVLAVLLLTSFVILLIWTTVLTSMKYNITETKKIRMQQEANYVIAGIQRIHRQCDSYTIVKEKEQIWMVNCKNGTIPDKQINSGNGIIINGLLGENDDKRVINSKTDDTSIDLDLILEYSLEDNVKLAVSTVITRYEVDKSGED